MSGLPFDPIIIAVVAVVVILIGILASGYVKAPADKAYIISGLKKVPKVLIGRAGIKIPFLERKDELLLKQIGIDIKTGGYVPTKDFIGVDIDAIAKIRLISMQDVAKRKPIPEQSLMRLLTAAIQKMEIKNIQLIQKLLQSRLQKIWRVRQCGISLI